MDDTDAVDTLTRFGLTTYEARVFLALQRLGSGTASDVADVTDVPRSQVYGAADSLADRGLVDHRQTRPTVYDPVDIETAEERLLEQFESAGRELFGYMADIQGKAGSGGEISEALWTIRGSEEITERVAELIVDAEERVLYGTARHDHYDEQIKEAMATVTDKGVTPLMMSTSEEFLEEADDDRVYTTYEPPEHIPRSSSRVLMVDDDTLLLGMVDNYGQDDEEEIALWSAQTASAAVLMQLITELFQNDPVSLGGE